VFLIEIRGFHGYTYLMRILGIDPGLQVTGYGVLESHNQSVRLIEAGVVRTDRSESLERRLHELSRQLDEIITQLQPSAVAIEDLYSHYAHPKTAIIMGHARGIVFLKAAEAGLPVFQYAATRIKKALTGNGRATKSQMQLMVKSTLALDRVPEPPDAADAMAIALCHCRHVVEKELVVS
jgi:crossover junction endodeoxyribonuclease RuvC